MSWGSGGTPDVPWEDGDEQTYDLSVVLPAGVMPQHGLSAVAFFDAEGTLRYGFRLEGEASLTSILGLLEVVKAHIIKDADEW